MSAAVWEVNHDGGAGGVSRDLEAGTDDPVCESVRTAERGAFEESRYHGGQVGGFGFCGDGSNAQSLVFPNGSRIVAIPATEDTLLGYSAVNLMIIDEASRVPDSLCLALRPMLLVSDGDLWLISTIHGKRGFFYEAWEHGGDEWARFSVPATENPRIRPDQLERERSEIYRFRGRTLLPCATRLGRTVH